MDKKEKIKLRISALLSKTAKNGATHDEAASALAMAQKLMKQYFIAESELSDPFLGEKCISRSIPRIKTGYNISYFYNELAKLFDCEYYYSRSTIVFFGFPQDVELCCYFYQLIERAALKEKDKYTKSRMYEIQCKEQGYHGRTLDASFIKGFVIRIAKRMDELYKERESEFDANIGYGLIIQTKKDKVEKSFNSLGFKISWVNQSLTGPRSAFDKGLEKGNEFELTQGIQEAKRETITRLN